MPVFSIIKEKELRESFPTKLLMGRKQNIWTTSAVFLLELKRKGKANEENCCKEKEKVGACL